MIWRLFRREPLAGVAVATGVAAAWAAFVPDGTRAPVASGLLPVILLAAAPGKRATLFEAALPIAARSLFVARLLFVLAAVWAPVAAAGLVAQVRHEPGWWGAGMALTAAGVFALTDRIEQFGSHAMVYYGAAFVLVILTFTPHGIVVGAACAVAAVLRLGNAWGRIPAAFQAAPREAGEARASRAGSSPTFALLPVVRSVFPPMAVLMLAIVLVEALFGIWGMGLILGASFVGIARRSTRWLWALPISRRALLVLVAGPYLALLVGGFAIGAWLRPLRFASRNVLPVSADSTVPVEEWRVAGGRSAPAILAPWGETAAPLVMRYPGFVVYDPFTVGRDNSRRFHDWQFARATEAIYGEAMSPSEYRDRRGELRPMSLRLRGVTNISGIIAAIGMLGLFCFFAIDWRRVTDLPKPARYAAQLAAVALAFLPAISPVSTPISMVALRVSPALAILVAAAAWLLLEWQSRTIEQARPLPLTR